MDPSTDSFWGKIDGITWPGGRPFSIQPAKGLTIQGRLTHPLPRLGERIRLQGWLEESNQRIRLKKIRWFPMTQEGRFPWVEACRSWVRNRLQDTLGPEEVGIAKALLLGERKDLQKDLFEDYRRFGLLHLLAISGLHFWFWDALLKRGIPWHRSWLRHVLLLLIATLAGWGAPVFRVYAALVIRDLGLWKQRSIPSLRLWSLAMWGEILVFPARLFGLSFVLTYGATFALLWAMPPRKCGKWRRILQPSLAAFLATAPTLYCFQGTIEPWSIVSTPIFALLLPLRLAAGFLALLPGGPWLAQLVFESFRKVEQTMFQYLDFLPATPWVLCQLNPWVFAIACLGIIFFLNPLWVKRWPQGSWVATATLGLSLVIPFRGKPGLAMLPVGHGLLAIGAGQKRTFIFDIGSQHLSDLILVDRLLIPFLAAKSWPKPTEFIASHQDWDHVGGKSLLFQRISLTEINCPSGQQRSLLGYEPLQVNMFGCARTESDSTNQGGHALDVRWPQGRAIFLGDPPGPILRDLVNRMSPGPVNILFAPHHGRDTDQVPQLVDYFKPQEVWNSAASKDGIPAVFPLLQKRHIPLHQSHHGPIVYSLK